MREGRVRYRCRYWGSDALTGAQALTVHSLAVAGTVAARRLDALNRRQRGRLSICLPRWALRPSDGAPVLAMYLHGRAGELSGCGARVAFTQGVEPLSARVVFEGQPE